jgi:hypothetical protein
MSKFKRGDDVLVDFGGLVHRGEVISQSAGYVMARILSDPVWDYGNMSPRLDPEPTVCVKETRVRKAE